MDASQLRQLLNLDVVLLVLQGLPSQRPLFLETAAGCTKTAIGFQIWLIEHCRTSSC